MSSREAESRTIQHPKCPACGTQHNPFYRCRPPQPPFSPWHFYPPNHYPAGKPLKKRDTR